MIQSLPFCIVLEGRSLWKPQARSRGCGFWFDFSEDVTPTRARARKVSPPPPAASYSPTPLLSPFLAACEEPSVCAELTGGRATPRRPPGQAPERASERASSPLPSPRAASLLLFTPARAARQSAIGRSSPGLPILHEGFQNPPGLQGGGGRGKRRLALGPSPPAAPAVLLLLLLTAGVWQPLRGTSGRRLWSGRVQSGGNGATFLTGRSPLSRAGGCASAGDAAAGLEAAA